MASFLDPIIGQNSSAGMQASISGNGSVVSGRVSPASSLVVATTDGIQLAAGKAGSDGSFILRLGSAQTNGEKLSLSITAQDGGKAETMDLLAPDFTGPRPVEEVSITSDGNFVYGIGAIPGEPVRVMSEGTMLGYARAEADGRFNVELAEPQINSQSLKVYAFDAMGNASEPVHFQCPDLTIPTAEGVRISGNGAFIEGQTEPFARVAVSSEPDPFASSIFLATVNDGYADAHGRFFMELKKPATNGETIYVAVADEAKNCSEDIQLDAPDLQQPEAPQTTVIESHSRVITGLGEPGTVAIVTDANNQIIAQAPVARNGMFEIGLERQALADGDVVEVSLVDEAGNISVPVQIPIQNAAVDAASTEEASGVAAGLVPEVAPADAIPQLEAPVVPVAELQVAVPVAPVAVAPMPEDEAAAPADAVLEEPAPQPSSVIIAEVTPASGAQEVEAPEPATTPAPADAPRSEEAEAPGVTPAAATIIEPVEEADAATFSVKKRAVALPAEDDTVLADADDAQGEVLSVIYSDTPCGDDGEGDFLFTQEAGFDPADVAGDWDHSMLARLASFVDEYEAGNDVEMFYI